MKVIYEPKGRAKEYADLAFNSYLSCHHGCKYCYAKNVTHKTAEEFHKCDTPRSKSGLKAFEKDCIEMERNGDSRRVHMNFVSDPYPEVEKELGLTRFCIETAMKHGVGINILTKGKYDTISRDLELFKRAGVHFGVTCTYFNDECRKEWEPNASTVDERIRLLTEVHDMGIFTWVSIEPVIYPEEALKFFQYCQEKKIVDLWKVGKLNYHPHEKEVDWAKFREEFKAVADKMGAKYIIKKDLMEAK